MVFLSGNGTVYIYSNPQNLDRSPMFMTLLQGNRRVYEALRSGDEQVPQDDDPFIAETAGVSLRVESVLRKMHWRHLAWTMQGIYRNVWSYHVYKELTFTIRDENAGRFVGMGTLRAIRQ